MSWADKYIKELQEGKSVEFRPTGRSMEPVIQSGALVTVMTCTPNDDGWMEPEFNDIVLCEVDGNQYLHFIKEVLINEDGTHYHIGNNRGGYNGWIKEDKIYGVVTQINNDSRPDNR